MRKKESFTLMVLLVAVALIAIFEVIPGPFYDPVTKQLSRINLALVSFLLLVVAA